MKIKNNKIFIYPITAFFSLLIVSIFIFQNEDFTDDYSILETSLLNVLQNILEDYKPEPPDIAIESVTLKKTKDPSDTFNYRKFTSTLVLHNYGGDLNNGQLKLSADNKKHVYVRNTDSGFSLPSNESYIIRDFEVLFDGDYNGGKVAFEIEMEDRNDYFSLNNSYLVDIFDLPANLSGIEIEEILKDNTVVLDFEIDDHKINDYDFEVFYCDNCDFDPHDFRYDEILIDDEIYSYFRLKNSSEIIDSKNWYKEEVSALEARFIEFDENPFDIEEEKAVFVKATDPETGNFVVSNIIVLTPQEEINKAQFATVFVDYAGIEIFDDGPYFYEDVIVDEWYAVYVQTLYNLGLLDIESYRYFPANTVSRGDATIMALDYYDVDLVIPEEAPHFEDVLEENEYFIYIESLFSSGKAGLFENNFYPEKPASKNFLRYLVNGFSESN